MKSTFQLGGEAPPAPKISRTRTPEQAREYRQDNRRSKRDQAQERAAQMDALLFPPATESETNHRHGWWKNERAKMRAALVNHGATGLTLNHWDNCGSQCIIEHSKSEDRFRMRANYCHHRLCRPCQGSKGKRIRTHLQKKMIEVAATNRTEKCFRFITLTLQHDTATVLAPQIKRIYDSFRKLRNYRTPKLDRDGRKLKLNGKKQWISIWKDSQKGGSYALETKLTENGWHVHLHIISEGAWMNVQALQSAWLEITGDSTRVDIRMCDNPKDAAFYVTKYVTKPTDSSVTSNPEALSEWIIATKGLRTCSTFGTWRGLKLTEVPPGPDDWQPQMTLDQLYERVAGGDIAARGILGALIKKVQTDPDG